MPIVRRTARVPHTAAQMFSLVNDVEAYPSFLRWCSGSSITSRSEGFIEATLDVGIAGISKRFSTRNLIKEPSEIVVQLVSGPFRRLDGRWTFLDVEGGCEIEFELDYEMKPSPFSFAFAAVFEEIARTQISAFLRRADEIYGR